MTKSTNTASMSPECSNTIRNRSASHLNAIAAETSIAAAELEAAGLWERREGGHFVVSDDVLTTAIDYSEHTRARETECADRGRHLPHEPDGSGWIVCMHCGVSQRWPAGHAGSDRRRRAWPRGSVPRDPAPLPGAPLHALAATPDRHADTETVSVGS